MVDETMFSRYIFLCSLLLHAAWSSKCNTNQDCQIQWPCYRLTACIDETCVYSNPKPVDQTCLSNGYQGKCSATARCQLTPCQEQGICDYGGACPNDWPASLGVGTTPTSSGCLCFPGYTGDNCSTPELELHFNGHRSDLQHLGVEPSSSFASFLDPWRHCASCRGLASNSVCDADCNNAQCLYDGGDCNLELACPSTCAPVYHDGRCDPQCDTSPCAYDGGDCLSQGQTLPTVDINVPQANTSLVLLQLQLLLPTVLLTSVTTLTSSDSQTVSVPFDPACSALSGCQLDSATAARMINAGIATERLRLSASVSWRALSSPQTYTLPVPTASPNTGDSTSSESNAAWTPIVIAVVALAVLCVVLIFTVTRARAKRRSAVAHQHEDGYLDTHPGPHDVMDDPFNHAASAVISQARQPSSKRRNSLAEASVATVSTTASTRFPPSQSMDQSLDVPTAVDPARWAKDVSNASRRKPPPVIPCSSSSNTPAPSRPVSDVDPDVIPNSVPPRDYLQSEGSDADGSSVHTQLTSDVWVHPLQHGNLAPSVTSLDSGMEGSLRSDSALSNGSKDPASSPAGKSTGAFSPADSSMGMVSPLPSPATIMEEKPLPIKSKTKARAASHLTRGLWGAAASQSQTDVLRKLYRSDPEGVNRVDEQGRCPAHFACLHRRLDTLRLLLEEMSAFVDGAAPGWNGQSPLHVACAQQWDQGVELLIRHNANLNLRDDAGCTPLMVCVKLKATTCMTLMLRSTRHFMSMEDSAERRTSLRRCDQPLSRLRNGERLPYTVVDVPDKKGWTALHHAAASSDGLHAISMLTRHRADINAITKLGETPLHIASREGNALVVRSLLSKQAATDVRDRYGRTPADVLDCDGSSGLKAMLQTTALKTEPVS
eukprot:m.293116 g.293116  ORF g.293116 m.293116 type:complete len:887 (+) comp18575_c0_seq1:230-2890(+)